jgi:ribosomal protein L12E/L44/L45/RPP1/RPP2
MILQTFPATAAAAAAAPDATAATAAAAAPAELEAVKELQQRKEHSNSPVAAMLLCLRRQELASKAA